MFQKLSLVVFVAALPWAVAPVLSQGIKCPQGCREFHCWRFGESKTTDFYRVFVGESIFKPYDPTAKDNQTCRVVSYIQNHKTGMQCKLYEPAIEMTVYKATGDIVCIIPNVGEWGEPKNCTKGQLAENEKHKLHACMY